MNYCLQFRLWFVSGEFNITCTLSSIVAQELLLKKLRLFESFCGCRSFPGLKFASKLLIIHVDR